MSNPNSSEGLPQYFPTAIAVVRSPLGNKWEIYDSKRDISFEEVSLGLTRHFLKNRDTSAIASPTTNPSERITLTFSRINEGRKQGIFLVTNESANTQAILILGKNKVTDDPSHLSGFEQTRQDNQNLKYLKSRIPPNAPLSIPQVLSPILEIQEPINRESTFPVYFMEFLDGFQELSCTSAPNLKNEHLFLPNQASLDLHEQQKLAVSEINNKLLNAEIVRMLARSQTLVYFALGERTQKEFLINAGDYLVMKGDANGKDYHKLALITLRGGISEQITFENFLLNLFLHEEQGFHLQVGSQVDTITPFANQPDQTIKGIEEALMLTPGIKAQEKLLGALTFLKLKYFQKGKTSMDETSRQKILTAIEQYGINK